MKEEVRSWLEQAEVDLQTAQKNLVSGSYYVASFLSQQAAEKALKALLLSVELKIPKVHDLVFLAKRAGGTRTITAKV